MQVPFEVAIGTTKKSSTYESFDRTYELMVKGFEASLESI